MIRRCGAATAAWALLASLAVAQPAPPLKLLTFNIWSGLDYAGSTTVGEFETPEIRARRTDSLIALLRRTRPDVISLQEVNPSYRLASRIAGALDYSFIAQRVIGGVKLGLLGIPYNLNEGGTILARRDLELEFVDVVRLSDAWGAIGNTISFHFSEQNAALVGRIRVNGQWIYLASVHLPADAPDTDETRDRLRAAVLQRGGSEADVAATLTDLRAHSDRRRTMLDDLCADLSRISGGAPMVLLGDLNAEPASADVGPLLQSGFVDAAASVGAAPTWDPDNPLVRMQADTVFATALEEISAWYDARPHRIDHVLLNAAYPAASVRGSEIIGLAFPVSDHYGLLVHLDPPPSVTTPVSTSFEFLPILSYDTDVGFGYGVKAFWLNPLGHRESFDLVLFNSTKGERWYRAVVSIPDRELRQGTEFDWAVDLVADYDKYLKNGFFGVGGGSRYADRQVYTREPLELQATISRSLSRNAVATMGARYQSVRNFNLPPPPSIMAALPPLSRGRADAFSLLASLRRDSRNSFINPSTGAVLQAEVEWAPYTFGTTSSFGRFGAWSQYYVPLFYPKTVLAVRAGIQTVFGDRVPIQFLVPVGGNATLRGSPQDRYLLNGTVIVNAELRFPIVWRFGGVLGWDAALVEAGRWTSIPLGWGLGSGPSPGEPRWASNPVVGLRFFMDTFIVRADLGFGDETTGFYLNFGHLF
jgi:endonuclease/exonuclease/phosphatase family metal-dependent hydrolase